MESNEEKFEISIRVMGREVFAFSLLSDSKRKNWVAISIITIIVIIALMEYALPGLTALMATV